MRPRIRHYREGDLGGVVGLCEREGVVHRVPDGLSIDEVADLVTSAATETLLAEVEGEVVGLAVGAVSGAVGSIYRVVGDRGSVDGLLDGLEGRLANQGARIFTTALHSGTELHALLEDRGYETADGVVVLRRVIEHRRSELADLGGQHIDAGLWDELEGMDEVKGIIERRIILPLAEPELALRHGVTAPQSVVLFGPPGTGKTTFAKGIASRLRWPFVPVEVAQLGEGSDAPAVLVDTFDRLLAAPAAVAFFDEVEDLAANRQSDRRVGGQVTNEFLRQLPRMRESFDHLLVCATNSVGSLDPAFLRPGRFDYVVPVGPPDADARAAIWRRYIADITDEDIDVGILVEASERFTPADLEFAARKAAQLAFEAEHAGERSGRAGTDEFVAAIRATRPTLTDEMIESFERDVETFARY
ncbi:MAG: ATP-binding protein [Actinobacteria bacterium]|nr:ATP-binding protein [Actinomycetota bacterium]